MANDIARTIDRNRAIFTNLLRQLPSADREAYLSRLADFYQERVDDILAQLDGAPVSVRPRQRPTPPVAVRPAESVAPVQAVAEVPAAPAPAPAPIVEVAEPVHVHTPDCDHVQAAVHSDGTTVPSVIRAVLATERAGLAPRQIKDGVRLLRPETDDQDVDRALWQMHKRKEIAREGVHKNYRYRLTGALTSLSAGVLSVANGNAGGATH